MQIQPTFGDQPFFREPDQLLSSLFNSPVVGVCTIDRRMRYEAINDALALINGIPAKAHPGNPLRSVLGDFTDIVLPSMESVFSSGQSISFEASGKLPSRPDVGHWIENYFPICNGGQVTHIGVVVVEITEQRKLEQALKHVTRRMDDLEAIVAKHTASSQRRGLDSLTEDLLLLADHLPPEVATEPALHSRPFRSLEDIEREYISRVLSATEGRVSGPDGAAEKLGLKRTTLQSRMQKLGIARSQFRTSQKPHLVR